MTLIKLIFVLQFYINNINYIYFMSDLSYELNDNIHIQHIQYDSYPLNASKEYQEEWLREKSLYYK